MSQKLIIALDSPTDAQRDAVTEFFRRQGGNLWHWLADVWLWAGAPADVSPRQLWSQLESVTKPDPIRGFVMTTGPDPKFWGNNRSESWKWLDRLWGTPDFSAEDRHRAGLQRHG